MLQNEQHGRALANCPGTPFAALIGDAIFEVDIRGPEIVRQGGSPFSFLIVGPLDGIGPFDGSIPLRW